MKGLPGERLSDGASTPTPGPRAQVSPAACPETSRRAASPAPRPPPSAAPWTFSPQPPTFHPCS